MSKRKNQKSRTNQRLVYAIAVAVVVIGIAGAVFVLTPAPSTVIAQHISPSDYQNQFIVAETDHYLLDVRTPAEFDGGHIPGAANIAVETLQSRLEDVPRDQPIVVYCRSGNRSAQASRILQQAGYTEVYDLGGINTWASQGYPVE